MSKEANLVLLPYNYLINVGMMQAFDLQLNGAIVIFDEAHNLVGFFLFESGCAKFRLRKKEVFLVLSLKFEFA